MPIILVGAAYQLFLENKQENDPYFMKLYDLRSIEVEEDPSNQESELPLNPTQ